MWFGVNACNLLCAGHMQVLWLRDPEFEITSVARILLRRTWDDDKMIFIKTEKQIMCTFLSCTIPQSESKTLWARIEPSQNTRLTNGVHIPRNVATNKGRGTEWVRIDQQNNVQAPRTPETWTLLSKKCGLGENKVNEITWRLIRLNQKTNVTILLYLLLTDFSAETGRIGKPRTSPEPL